MNTSPLPSTIGLAIVGAFWVLAILFILLSLFLALLLAGRARSMQPGTRNYGPVLGMLIPTSFSAVAAVEFRLGWSIAFSIAAFVFGLWCLNNIAKRDA